MVPRHLGVVRSTDSGTCWRSSACQRQPFALEDQNMPLCLVFVVAPGGCIAGIAASIAGLCKLKTGDVDNSRLGGTETME